LREHAGERCHLHMRAREQLQVRSAAVTRPHVYSTHDRSLYDNISQWANCSYRSFETRVTWYAGFRATTAQRMEKRKKTWTCGN